MRQTQEEIKKTKQKINNMDVKILRTLTGLKLRYRRTDESIRAYCRLQIINGCIKISRKFWDKHLDKMSPNKSAKICNVNKPYSITNNNNNRNRPIRDTDKRKLTKQEEKEE